MKIIEARGGNLAVEIEDLSSGGRDDRPTTPAPREWYMTEEDLVVYRRRLPHWRLTGSVYFVTWRLAATVANLTSDERGVIMSALKHFNGDRYELYAGVVMHDHVHVLVRPLGKHPLQELLHSWKSFTAHKLQQDYGRKTPIWQDEYLDRVVRDEQEFLDKIQYILNNPPETWPELEDYPWVWVKEDLEP